MEGRMRNRKVGCKILAAAGIILLILGMLLAAAVLLDPWDCVMAPGTRVDGLELEGMTLLQAKAALEDRAAKTLLARELQILLPQESLSFPAEELETQLDVWALTWDAYCQGRLGRPAGESLGLGAYLRWNREPVRRELEAWAESHDTRLTQPQWRLEGEAPALGTDVWKGETQGQTLVIRRGVPECHLDVDAVMALAEEAMTGSFSGNQRVTPEIVPAVLPREPDPEAIAGEIAREAVNDTLNMESYLLQHGSYGYGFDVEQMKSLLAGAEYGAEVSVPMVFTAPEILGDAVYFRDVLGTCETRHNDNANRNVNLQLLCQFLDGCVVEPGAVFSYNEAVGERTAERGFKPAPAYSGNRLIQDYGGGVCQGSTTLYNCLLLADLEILERNCHGAPVGYVPRGLDAAVNWATKTDLRFRNTSHFPVKIQAEVSDGYVKMKLLGTDEKDYTVKMESFSNQEETVIYAVSYKCRLHKITGEELSREVEARSTYYTDLG